MVGLCNKIQTLTYLKIRHLCKIWAHPGLSIKLLYPLARGGAVDLISYWPPKKLLARILYTKYASTEVPVTLEDQLSTGVTSCRLSEALMLHVFLNVNFSDCNNKKRILDIK